MVKKTLALLAVMALSATAAACTSSPAQEATTPDASAQSAQTATAAPDLGIDSLTMTYVTSPLNVPSIAGKRLGTFEDAFGAGGATVSYAELTTGPEQTAALASGDVQVLFGVGATSVILAAAGGADVAILDTYSRSPEAFTLITGANGPTSPADLVGKTVGGPKGTILHELLLAYLATGGFGADDVNFVDMTIPAAQAALAGGSVDVALLAGPAASQMVSEGFRQVTNGEGLVGATIVVATTREFAQEHPEAVATFRTAHRAVLDYMAAHEDEVLAMAADETGLAPEAVSAMYGMYDFDADVRPDDIDAMKKTEEFMLANGMIDEPIDISSLVLPAE